MGHAFFSCGLPLHNLQHKHSNHFQPKKKMAITKFRTSIQYIHSQKVASVAHQKVPISVVNSL